MPATFPESGPDDAQPLSDHERRVIGDLESELAESAPDLTDAFTRADKTLARSAMSGADRVLQAVAVLVVLAVLLPSEWRTVLAVFGVLSGAVALALWVDSRAGDPRSRHSRHRYRS
ncbi:MAG: DUF3040 domain-containing protein [Pseudonocardia sp.]|nr:DUF3040 domain-containing protein [Pseudonocardia sp.]